MVWVLRMSLAPAIVTIATAACLSSEWKQFRDMCYWRSDYGLTWMDAERACVSTFPGSDMVSIHDLYLDAFIADDLLSGQPAWLGLHRASGSEPWVWTDGSVYNYSRWFGGNPDCISNRFECCATINHGNQGGIM